MPHLTPPLRIGLLGHSEIARRRFIPAIANSGCATLTAIGTRRSGDTPVAGIPTCTYDQLLARPDVDLVYISLPNDLHEHWTLRTLAAGQHVLCEKPLASSLPSVERMIEAARNARRLLFENLMFLQHPQHAIVRELAGGATLLSPAAGGKNAAAPLGRIGKLQSLRSTFTFELKPDPANFRFDPARGGGACADLLTYTVGTAELFGLGELRNPTGTITYRDGLDISAHGSARLRDDIRFEFSISFNQPYESAYELTGDEGTLHLDRAYTTPPELANTLKLRTATGEETIPLPAADHFAETIRHVARLIAANDHEPTNLATLRRHQTIARIKRSLRNV